MSQMLGKLLVIESSRKHLPNALWSTSDGASHGDTAAIATNLPDKLVLLLQSILAGEC